MRKSRSFLGTAFRVLLLLPIKLTWRFATFVCTALGIFLTLLLALALIVVGYLLISSIIGFLFGLPLLILGIFLLARALY